VCYGAGTAKGQDAKVSRLKMYDDKLTRYI
jgi:hypothetical protein